MKDLTWTFVRVKGTRGAIEGMDYGWMLKITNMIHLFAYNLNIIEPMCKQIGLVTGKKRHGDAHYELVKMVAENSAERGVKISLAEALAKQMDKAFMVKWNAIQEYGCIYINHNGGFTFPRNGSIEETGTPIKTEAFAFPDKKKYTMSDSRISRHPGCPHYYSKVGGYDVIIGEVMKWNTPKDAEDATKKFIRQLNVVNKEAK